MEQTVAVAVGRTHLSLGIRSDRENAAYQTEEFARRVELALFVLHMLVLSDLGVLTRMLQSAAPVPSAQPIEFQLPLSGNFPTLLYVSVSWPTASNVPLDEVERVIGTSLNDGRVEAALLGTYSPFVNLDKTPDASDGELRDEALYLGALVLGTTLFWAAVGGTVWGVRQYLRSRALRRA